MKQIFIVALTLSLAGMLQAQPGGVQFKPDYLLYDQILQRHVDSDGLVDYKALKSDSDFGIVLKSMSLMHPNARWSREEQICFWVNTYNMFVMKLICDNYPVNSIMDIPGAFDREFIKIGAHNYSLNYIEKEMLLKKFNEPRIHFVINCAARSCPPLLNKAYRPEALENTMKAQTRSFINDSRFNDLSENRIEISKIFEWYAADFSAAGSVINYLIGQSSKLISEKAKIHYKEYDWSLNAQ